MTFTAMHRALGLPPGPITNEMLDRAVADGVVETDDLDWKSDPPPTSGLSSTDFPKDVAAFANAGGGILVYGVKDEQKRATERVDVGDLGDFEHFERALLAVVFSAISPPVFGVKVHLLGEEPGPRSMVVEVPASVDGPHLIYKNQLFGAPIRYNADTQWMRERQIETMYRARFDERRHATEAVDALYRDALAGRDTDRRAWLIAVAHPRVPRIGSKLSRYQATTSFSAGEAIAKRLMRQNYVYGFEAADIENPRPGLRRWVAPGRSQGSNAWKETWLSIHDDGSAVVAQAVGGSRIGANVYLPGNKVTAELVEQSVATLIGLMRAVSATVGIDEYTARVGVEFGEQKLHILAWREDTESPVPLARFTPVEMSLSATASDQAFLVQTREIAADCVNQGGVEHLAFLKQPVDD